MKRKLVGYVTTVACNLGCVALLVVVATCVLSSLFSLGDDGGVKPPQAVASKVAVVSEPRVETTRVRMKVGAGRSCSEYSLEDEEGRELLRVTYGRRGFVVVNLGEVFPIRPGFSATTDGSCDFAMAQDGLEHRLRVRPDGTSGFLIASRSCPFGESDYNPLMIEHP